MTPETVAGMKVNSLENMNEHIIKPLTIFTLTFTNTSVTRAKSPPRPVINAASVWIWQITAASNPKDPPPHRRTAASMMQQGRLGGKLQIYHLTMIRRINEHVDVARLPQIRLSLIGYGEPGSARARVRTAGIYCATVIQQSHLICLCPMLGIKAIWHSHDGRLKLGWFPTAHISPDFICL